VAFLEGCGGATAPADTRGVQPVTAGGETTTPAPGASGSGSRPVTPPPPTLGLCSGADARRLFLDTVEQVIVPGLERQGIPARRAWLASEAERAA